MKAADVFLAALWALGARPWRSFAIISSLAMGVATAAFIGSVTLGFGQELQRLAFGVYSRALVVRENSLIIDRHAPPRLADVTSLRALEGAISATAWRKSSLSIWTGEALVALDVFGTAGPYLQELDSPIAVGRSFTEEESWSDARVCLLGAETALNLGLTRPVGEILRLGGGSCEIIGILGEPKSRPAAQYAEAVIMPFRPSERIAPGSEQTRPGEANWITVGLNRNLSLSRAEMRADLALRRLRGSPLSEPSPFAFGNSNASLAQIQEQQDLIGRLLITLGSLSLAASLTAYASIVASGTSQRGREFALRLALGADERSLQLMVFTENLALGGFGALVGLGIGVGLACISGTIWGWPFAWNWLLGGTALGLGLLVGVVTGAAMAWRISGLSPSLAVRS